MADLPRSPLAPARAPELPAIAGVRLATVAAGVRYRNRADLTLAELSPGTQIAGVFTQNKMPGAPIDWCRRILAGGSARAILVKAGNANVFTGRRGLADVEAAAAQVAAVLNCTAEDVFIASTGVIGEALPMQNVAAGIKQLPAGLSNSGWPQAAEAICTTDTFAKLATQRCEIAGVPVILNGIAKGSGMIAPDMATMLAFLFTDAALPAAILQPLLNQAVARSFNCITVDGDTSTSDTVLLAATGAADHARPGDSADASLEGFRQALDRLCQDLALQIVKDGEGASKLIEIRITGAESWQAARRIGLTIGNSPLVKTAIAGGDANWGRIVMAVGRAGERADRDALKIEVGGVVIAEKGDLNPAYHEDQIAQHMQGDHIVIEVDVGIADASATVWSCDLTHGYIDINADYRS